MDAAAAEDVWRMLGREREQLIAVARGVPQPLFASISGAHLYGFASPNSDVDLRGAFVRPARELLSLWPAKETINQTLDAGGTEVDWVVHDVRKFVRLMTQDNGYVLEQLFSPLVVVGSDELEPLRELGRRCMTRRLLRHYRGFAHGRRRLLAEPGATVKHLLYAYRVYLTGIVALSSGEIESHLPTLNQRRPTPRIEELVLRKREGAEKQALEAGEAAEHADALDQLERELEATVEHSPLPEQIDAAVLAELDAFVVRVRIGE